MNWQSTVISRSSSTKQVGEYEKFDPSQNSILSGKELRLDSLSKLKQENRNFSISSKSQIKVQKSSSQANLNNNDYDQSEKRIKHNNSFQTFQERLRQAEGANSKEVVDALKIFSAKLQSMIFNFKQIVYKSIHSPEGLRYTTDFLSSFIAEEIALFSMNKTNSNKRFQRISSISKITPFEVDHTPSKRVNILEYKNKFSKMMENHNQNGRIIDTTPDQSFQMRQRLYQTQKKNNEPNFQANRMMSHERSNSKDFDLTYISTKSKGQLSTQKVKNVVQQMKAMLSESVGPSTLKN